MLDEDRPSVDEGLRQLHDRARGSLRRAVDHEGGGRAGPLQRRSSGLLAWENLRRDHLTDAAAELPQRFHRRSVRQVRDHDGTPRTARARCQPRGGWALALRELGCGRGRGRTAAGDRRSALGSDDDGRRIAFGPRRPRRGRAARARRQPRGGWALALRELGCGRGRGRAAAGDRCSALGSDDDGRRIASLKRGPQPRFNEALRRAPDHPQLRGQQIGVTPELLQRVHRRGSGSPIELHLAHLGFPRVAHLPHGEILVRREQWEELTETRSIAE
mmetsp:Transcript_124573/g.398819  ORF Transcript_124573/g.398819 Transcript_124573/m.398819 type:complete len:274 (-) Transcript_124573:1374-2195(-)